MTGDIIQVQYILYGHETPLDDLEKSLHTNLETGLSKEEAKRRLKLFGKNEITTPKPNVWKLYFAPLLDTLITLYLIMTIVMFLLAIFVEGVFTKISIWLFMIALNIILAIYQQFRAQKKIEALLRLSPPRAKIIRDNTEMEIYANELVPGDIILLSTGDKVPADARIIRSNNLTVNESSLTGESVPVEKYNDGNLTVELGEPIAKHKNFLYLGTFIQTGNAIALIVRTGNSTELGKIASAISEMHTLDIPLRNKVNDLGKKLSNIMLVFLAAKITFNLILQIKTGFNLQIFFDSLVDSILIAMSVVPINIPLLTTIILISGVLNMAKRKVIVKNLATIETLGRCSVLCSDKTGTLTTSKMSVKLLWDTQQYYGIRFKGLEYSITPIDGSMSDFLSNETLNKPPLINIDDGSPLELILTSAVLNNDAILQFVNNDAETHADYKVIGDSTDAALLVLGLAQGFRKKEIETRYVKYKDYPFDSKLKRMSGIFRDTLENDYMVFSKGATEVILERCAYIGDEANKKELTDEMRQKIYDEVNYFAENGYRVISLAYRALDDFVNLQNINRERELIEQDMTYIGFTVIYDPPRPGAREAVKDLDSAGIFPIMITGDSIKTAATIAKQVGILDPDEMVVEGRYASELPDEQFFKVSVFARVSPHDKEVIVSRYQDRGDVVTMTGDGVNDILAITKSDAGVSMGRTGTEVTKEAADLIIVDDSYVSLVRGVYEGRNLFEKIRIMIFFYLAINLAEALMYFSTSFIPNFYLINNWQRVYIFSIVHAFPVLAIIFGPSDKEIMKLKPRNNDAIISKELFFGLILFSFTYLASLITLYYITYIGIIPVFPGNIGNIIHYFGKINDPQNAVNLHQIKARTLLLSVMYLVESFIILSIRRINRPLHKSLGESNIFVWILILIGPIIHLLMQNQSLQMKLLSMGINVEIMPITFIDSLIIIGFASIPIIIFELYKYIIRSMGKQF